MGIKLETFNYPIPNKEGLDKYAFYYTPQRLKYLPVVTETEEWIEYRKKFADFKGVTGHKGVSTKHDPGPHFDLRKIKSINF